MEKASISLLFFKYITVVSPEVLSFHISYLLLCFPKHSFLSLGQVYVDKNIAGVWKKNFFRSNKRVSLGLA